LTRIDMTTQYLDGPGHVRDSLPWLTELDGM